MQRKGLFSLGLLALVVAMVVTACGGSSAGAGAGGAQDVRVSGNEFKFEPSTITVQGDKPVKVTFKNTGTVVHDFVIRGLTADVSSRTGAKPTEGDAAQHAVAIQAEAGQEASITFTPTQKGSFELICTVPGHADAGMKGTFVVQ